MGNVSVVLNYFKFLQPKAVQTTLGETEKEEMMRDVLKMPLKTVV